MGWLFAVALGLHRHSQRVVLASLIPIAVGHAVAVSALVIAVVTLGAVVDTAILSRSAGFVLLGYAGWHALYGHRQRLRIGMQTGLVGLFLWSFFDGECPWCRSDAYSNVDAPLFERLANKRISGQ